MRFLLIFFLFACEILISQTYHWDSTERKTVKVKKIKSRNDSILKGSRHVFGAGIQYMRGTQKDDGYDKILLEYNFPQFNSPLRQVYAQSSTTFSAQFIQ